MSLTILYKKGGKTMYLNKEGWFLVYRIFNPLFDKEEPEAMEYVYHDLKNKNYLDKNLATDKASLAWIKILAENDKALPFIGDLRKTPQNPKLMYICRL